MQLSFTNVGEFRRGKGTRKTRFGPRMRKEDLIKKGEKQNLTPDQIAINKLDRLLQKPSLEKTDRDMYTNLLRGAEQLRFMNMPVLAQVILFMNSKGNVVTADNFNYMEISGYIEVLLPERESTKEGGKGKYISEDELNLYRLRMAATFLRYIRYIQALLEQNEEIKKQFFEKQEQA